MKPGQSLTFSRLDHTANLPKYFDLLSTSKSVADLDANDNFIPSSVPGDVDRVSDSGDFGFMYEPAIGDSLVMLLTSSSLTKRSRS
jgi:hypothetical protein